MFHSKTSIHIDKRENLFESDMASVNEVLKEAMTNDYLVLDSVKYICEEAIRLLANQSKVLPITAPFKLCQDNLEWVIVPYQKRKRLDPGKYVCFIDIKSTANCFVAEFTKMICLKLKYPRRLSLLRGKLNDAHVPLWRQKCVTLYGDEAIWDHLFTVFNLLPQAALLDQKFCMFGDFRHELEKCVYHEIPMKVPESTKALFIAVNREEVEFPNGDVNDEAEFVICNVLNGQNIGTVC